MSILASRIRLQYKKYLAIIFACLGLACFISDFLIRILLVANSNTQGASLTLDLLDLVLYLVMIVCFAMLLLGNIRASFLAFQGLLTFVFYELFSKGRESIIYFLMILTSGGYMDALSLLLNLLLASSAAFVAVSGIFSYIRTRQFISRTYGSYRTVRLWSLLFTLAVITSEGVYLAISLLGSSLSIYILLYILTPLGAIFMALSCFFTTLRLSYD